jgi:hypothetical protein
MLITLKRVDLSYFVLEIESHKMVYISGQVLGKLLECAESDGYTPDLVGGLNFQNLPHLVALGSIY